MKFRNAIGSKPSMSLTNNGALTHVSSGNALLDLFFLVGASRGKKLTAQFQTAHNQNKFTTASLMLWARDARGGAGERQQFRDYLTFLESADPDLLSVIVSSGKIQEVGRWDDYLVVTHPEVRHLAYTQIAKGLSDPQTLGLVAKWMPRQGKDAKHLCDFFGLSERNWRKRIVSSTHVVEQQMCAKEWKDINFEHVPSVAAARYQKAFTKHVPEEYAAYRDSLKKGTAKVNATTLYPYDVLKSVAYGDETVAQAQWDALPNFLGENGGILSIADVSGSMTSQIPGASVTCMDVAISLALYIATKQKGDFNNVVMSFSSESDIIKLKSKTLRNMYREVAGIHWGMSTDLNKAFVNLLNFGIAHDLSDADMPKTILIISDMEFNYCGHLTNMQAIERLYNAHYYTVPKIVFWNVNGRPGNNPVTHDKSGAALISGFSPSIMKSVLASEKFDPEAIMMKTIGAERYQLNF